MLHIPPTTHLLTAQTKTRATEKSLPFRKWRFREKKIRRMGQKDKTERVTGVGRRTREEM